MAFPARYCGSLAGTTMQVCHGFSVRKTVVNRKSCASLAGRRRRLLWPIGPAFGGSSPSIMATPLIVKHFAEPRSWRGPSRLGLEVPHVYARRHERWGRANFYRQLVSHDQGVYCKVSYTLGRCENSRKLVRQTCHVQRPPNEEDSLLRTKKEKIKKESLSKTAPVVLAEGPACKRPHPTKHQQIKSVPKAAATSFGAA